MAQQDKDPILDPIDGLSEVMFGLFMALTFTGTMSVALGSGATVHEVLLAALACNIAWGLVDASVHVLGTVTARLRRAERLRRIRAAPQETAQAAIATLLPGPEGQAIPAQIVADLTEWMKSEPEPPPGRAFHSDDAREAVAIFLRVCGATFPPILPFLLMSDLFAAMRLSNAVAVGMLMWIGLRLDREIGHGWRFMRILVPVAGVCLVVVTIALGG